MIVILRHVDMGHMWLHMCGWLTCVCVHVHVGICSQRSFVGVFVSICKCVVGTGVGESREQLNLWEKTHPSWAKKAFSEKQMASLINNNLYYFPAEKPPEVPLRSFSRQTLAELLLCTSPSLVGPFHLVLVTYSLFLYAHFSLAC